MNFFALTDLHGDSNILKQGLNNALSNECEFIIYAGDLTNFGAGLKKMMKELSKSKISVFLVAGNHETFSEINKECSKYDFINLHAQLVNYKGLTIAGLGGSNKTPFNTPNELSEEEIKEILDKFKGREKLLLVSHVPPYGYLDEVSGGGHAGSESVLEFIKTEQPLMVICGHIHEQEGRKVLIGKTEVINPGLGSVIDLSATS